MCNVRVNQFSLGFGPKLWNFQGKETLYCLRLIPLGGFVSMEGEMEKSDDKRAFYNAKVSKKIAIVLAGATVNIIFGILLYFFLMLTINKNISVAINYLQIYIVEFFKSLKMLFTGNISINDLTGPVGISGIISTTKGIKQYIYLLSTISISLGVTNLLPIPALDGGKIVLLIIEGIRKKPLKNDTEISLQLLGFSILIILSILVTYNDIIKIINGV